MLKLRKMSSFVTRLYGRCNSIMQEWIWITSFWYGKLYYRITWLRLGSQHEGRVTVLGKQMPPPHPAKPTDLRYAFRFVPFALYQDMKSYRGRKKHSSTLSLTLVLGGVGDWIRAPAALASRNTRYPLYRRPGGFQGGSGRVRKISPPTGIRSPDRPARSEWLYGLSYLIFLWH